MTNIINEIKPEDIEWVMKWSEYEGPRKGEDETVFEEGKALAHLLINEVVFLNSMHWEEGLPEHIQESISVNVLCSDTFGWACADAEPLPYNQIEPLYKLWKANGYYGVVRWCCIQRNLQPINPRIKIMKDRGLWDDVMEKLEQNPSHNIGKKNDQTQMAIGYECA